jgi:hypothetical protein
MCGVLNTDAGEKQNGCMGTVLHHHTSKNHRSSHQMLATLYMHNYAVRGGKSTAQGELLALGGASSMHQSLWLDKAVLLQRDNGFKPSQPLRSAYLTGAALILCSNWQEVT